MKTHSFKLVGKDYFRNIKAVVISVYGDLVSFEVAAVELPGFVRLSDYLYVCRNNSESVNRSPSSLLCFQDVFSSFKTAN